MQLANAAHPFPYHYSAAKGMLEALQMPSLPLGIRLPPGSPGGFAEVDVEMGAGDFLGALQRWGDGYAGRDRGVLRSGEVGNPEPGVCGCGAEGLLEAVLEDMKRFRGTASQNDDVTLLVLQVQAEGEASNF